MKSVNELQPWRVVEVKRDAIGLRGWVVIDAHEHGYACGGVRMRSEVTADEIANLAHEMTLKYRFLNIRKDGAKAGILAPIDSPPARKRELCRAFGEEIGKLMRDNVYTPGEDMGIGHAELDEIVRGAGLVPKEKQNPAEYYTALTAVICFEEYCHWRKLDLSRLRVSIEGYGKVGSCAGKLLAAAGSKLVGISTAAGAIYKAQGLDLNLIESLQQQHGDALVQYYPGAERMPREELITRPADCFFPGAQPDSIHSGNIDSIKARCLISIANIAADEKIEAELARRSIDYFPGFVANCGGILSYYLREQDFALDELEEFIRSGFGKKIRVLLDKSAKVSIAAAAREIAIQNGARLRRQSPRWRKLLSPRRFGWLLYRNAGRYGLRGLLLPYARQYMRSQLFLS